MTRDIFKILVSCFYTFSLLYFLLKPTLTTGEIFLFEHSDKLIHGLAFLAFIIILHWGMPLNRKFLTLFVVFVAVFSDIAQIYVPGRFFDLWDILANLVGVFLGYFLSKTVSIYKENILNSRY